MNQGFLLPGILDTLKMSCFIYLDLIYSTLQKKMKESSLTDFTKVFPKVIYVSLFMLMLQFSHEVDLTICSCGSAAMLDRKTMLKLVEPVYN